MTISRTNDSTFLGVTGHTFVATEATFDNGTNVASRACYCSEEFCPPSGLLDVSECKFNAPAYVGLPHFHLADPSYAEAVTGLDPPSENDSFQLTLEPVCIKLSELKKFVSEQHIITFLLSIVVVFEIAEHRDPPERESTASNQYIRPTSSEYRVSISCS